MIYPKIYRAGLIGLGVGFLALTGEISSKGSVGEESEVLYPPLEVPESLDRIRVPDGILPRTTEAFGGKITDEEKEEAWSSPWFDEPLPDPSLEVELEGKTVSGKTKGGETPEEVSNLGKEGEDFTEREELVAVQGEEKGTSDPKVEQGSDLEKGSEGGLNDMFSDILGTTSGSADTGSALGTEAAGKTGTEDESRPRVDPAAQDVPADLANTDGQNEEGDGTSRVESHGEKASSGDEVQEDHPLKLDPRYEHPFLQSLLSVLSNEPRLKAAMIQIKIEHERARQNRGEMLPSLNLVGTVESKHERSQDFFRDSSHPSQVGLVMTQPIYNRNNQLNYKVSKVKKEEIIHQSEEQKQVVIEDLCARYLDIHRFKVLAEFSRNNAGLSDQHYRSTKIRFEKGELTRTDVHQAVVRHKTSLAVREESDSQVEIARRRFEELTREIAPEDVPFFALDLSAQYMENIKGPNATRLRQDLKVLERQMEQEKLLGSVARSRHLPQLDLTVEQTRSWVDDPGTTPNPLDETRVALDLQWNLLNGTSSFYEIRERDLRIEQLRLNYLYQKREAERLISEGIYRVGITERLVENYGAAVEAADLALLGIQEEFLVGTRTSLDAFDAQNELFISQTRWINAKVDHLLAEVSLLRASGHLTLEYLATILRDDKETDDLQ